MMKYLESFDLFGGEYERISRIVFMGEIRKVGGLDLSEEQRVKLSKLFKNFFGRMVNFEIRDGHSFFCMPNRNAWFFIQPYDDEWYFIEIFNNKTNRGEYYKCDGIEGIKKMLSDKDEVFREI